MPFYQLNQFTGRLKQSTHIQPLYPLNPVPLDQAETVMIYDSLKTKPVTTAAPTRAGFATVTPQIAKAFQLYGRDLHAPVYRMAGTRDVILVRAITAVVFALNGFGIYKICERASQ